MTGDPAALVGAVRRNCDIADARHAQDMTLCNYLLAMREHYRWETGLAGGEMPDRAAVGAWIAERESRWESLADAPYEDLPVEGASLDPFDEEGANERLVARGWVYGASPPTLGRLQFFLGRLRRESVREGLRVIEVGEEVARGIQAAPAALRDRTIVLRRDAFERWLWASTEGWALGRGDGAMRAALDAYGHSRNRDRAIARMADEQQETLLLHELGEFRAGIELGEDWERWFGSLGDLRAERLARAVRDLLADCLVTLPALVERRDLRSTHFWFATFDGLRRSLFPRLVTAYESLPRAGEWTGLADACRAGAEHWAATARHLAGDPAAPVTPTAHESLRLA